MIQDEAIKYNSLYQEVRLAINNIHDLGFDTQNMVDELTRINDMVTKSVKYDYIEEMVEASYIQLYAKGIHELNKLKNKLDNYDVYVKAYNTCNFISLKLTDDISKDELAKIVSKLIYILKSIYKSGTVDYDSEKHIVEAIYEVAYNVIKLEILKTGESQLYLFIKNDDMNISYFNNLILKDIEKINLNDSNNKRIKTKMYELGQKGIYSNYLDLDLLKLIMLSTNSDELKEVIINNINILTDKIITSDGVVKELIREIESKQDNKLLSMIGLKDIKKDLKKKMTSLLLSVSLLLGGAAGIPLESKRVATNNSYIQTEDIYSSKSGDISHSERNRLVLGYTPKNKGAYLNIFYNDKTNIAHYDISGFEFDEPQDYYQYLLDNNIYLTPEELGKTDYFEIIVNHYQKYEGTNKEVYISMMTILYLMYIMFLLLMCPLTLINPYDSEKIKNILKKIKEGNVDLKTLLLETQELYGSLEIEINKNEELRNKFNELYNANKFLLDNPEELLSKINDVLSLERIERCKKLIKDSKKGR